MAAGGNVGEGTVVTAAVGQADGEGALAGTAGGAMVSGADGWLVAVGATRAGRTDRD
jgi:hypothetical protein